MDRPSIVTCLSDEEHTCDIKDYMLHYLGCIELCERDNFFKESNTLWKQELVHQEKLCGNIEKAKEIVEAKRESWESNCRSELKRIGFLRKVLAEDEDDKHLVEQVIESGDNWRKLNRLHIDKANEWRRSKGKSNSHPTEIGIKKAEKYEPEKDVNVPIIQFDNGKGVNLDDDRVWNTFPNQKINLSELLDKNSLLHQEQSSQLLRYFHIPSNNMTWAERAIGRYFNEQPPDYHATHRELIRENKTKTYMILREPYWRGQVHGGQQHSPPHDRHLRPLCSIISAEPKHVDHFPQNMVLFMPYLHWETSRKRAQFAAEMKKFMDKTKADASKAEQVQKNNRQKERQGLSGILKPNSQQAIGPRPNSATIPDVLKALKKLDSPRPAMDDMGRVEVGNSLGQYFLDAARLYEGMSNYRDKKILRGYLGANPPLHPRRTLDQAYFWSLKSTRTRDRDQVVYRGTTAKFDDLHTYHCKEDNTWEWTKHKNFGIEGTCSECKLNIQKLSRVVMVDQLWMWILDANTIITYFPERYGARKQDSSDIHKSIKARLNDTTIRTIFDLALVIIEECSNSCLGQTRTSGLQPHILDSFSMAISTVMHKQTTAFERLLRWTNEAIDIIRFKENSDTSRLHLFLLDIKQEGWLAGEIKDILEELDIIIQIVKTHKRILVAFIANAEILLDPVGYFGDNKKRKLAARYYGTDIKFETGDEQKSGEDFTWFKLNSDEKLETILVRIEELEELRVSAVDASENVHSLLELKQQQASVIQAWQASKQSKESFRQGRSIMVFTIVTIIFLPLSFMSSVFGMNNIEISGGTWPIKVELIYMFSISAGVIFLSLFFAFGGSIRKYLWTLFLVKSGLYGLLLDIDKRTLSDTSGGTDWSDWSDRLKQNVRTAHFLIGQAKKDREATRSQQDKETAKSRRRPSNSSLV